MTVLQHLALIYQKRDSTVTQTSVQDYYFYVSLVDLLNFWMTKKNGRSHGPGAEPQER
jgi:hypothetical protein